MLGIFQLNAVMMGGALSFSQAGDNWSKYILGAINTFKANSSDQLTYNEVSKHIGSLDFSGLNLTAQQELGFERLRSAFAPLIISLADGGINHNKDDSSKKTVSLLNDWARKTNNSHDASSELNQIARILKSKSLAVDQLLLCTVIYQNKFPANNTITTEQMDIAGDYLSGTLDYSDSSKLNSLVQLLSQSIYFNEKLAGTDELKFSVFERADLSPIWNLSDFNTVLTQSSSWGNFSAFEDEKGRELARYYVSSPEHVLKRLKSIFKNGLESQVEGAKLANSKDMVNFTFDDNFITSGLKFNSEEYYDKISCLNSVLADKNYMQDIWNIKDPNDLSKYLFRDIFSKDTNSSSMPRTNSGSIFNSNDPVREYKFAVLHNLLNAMATLELALDKFVYGFLEQIDRADANASGGAGPIRFSNQNGVKAWRDYLLKIEEIFTNPIALKSFLNDIVDKQLIKDQAMLGKIGSYAKEANPVLDDQTKNAVRAEILKRVLRFRLFFSSSMEIPEPEEMKNQGFAEKAKIALWQNARPLLYFYDYQKDIQLTPPDKFAHLIDGVYFDIFNLRNATPAEAKNLSFSNNTFAYHIIFDYMDRLKKDGKIVDLAHAFSFENKTSTSKYQSALKSLLPSLNSSGSWDMSNSIFFVCYAKGDEMVAASKMSYRDATMQGYQPFFVLKEPKYASYYDDSSRQDWQAKFSVWQQDRKPRGSTQEYADYPTYNIYNSKYRMLGLNSEGAQQIAIELAPPTGKSYYVDGDFARIPYDLKKRNSFINLDEGKTYETNWEYLISGTGKKANALAGIDSWGSFSAANVFSPAPLLGKITFMGEDRSGVLNFPISKEIMPENLERFAPKDYKASIVGKNSASAFDADGNPISIDVFNVRLNVSWTDTHALLSNGILYDPFTYLSAGHGSLNWQEYVVKESINPLDKTEFYNAAWKIPIYRSQEYDFTVRREAHQTVVSRTTQPDFPDNVRLFDTFEANSIKELTADGKLIRNHSRGSMTIAVEGGLVPPDLAGQVVDVDEKGNQTQVDAIIAKNVPVDSAIVHTKSDGKRMSFYLMDKNSDIYELKLREKSFNTGKDLYYDDIMKKSTVQSRKYELYDPANGTVVGFATAIYDKQPGEEIFPLKTVDYDIYIPALKQDSRYENFIFNLRTDEHGVLRTQSGSDISDEKVAVAGEPFSKDYKLFDLESKGYVNANKRLTNRLEGKYNFIFKIDKESSEYKDLQKRIVGEENPDTNTWIMTNEQTGGKLRLKTKDESVNGSTKEYILYDDDGNILLKPAYDQNTKTWQMDKGPQLENKLKQQINKSEQPEKIGSLFDIGAYVPQRA